MSLTPKTIQIFLPGGDPRGIRIAEVTTRIVQVIEVPRVLLADFLQMPEAAQVAVYFLVGQGEGGGEPQVYVGQTGDLRARLTTHNKEKEFWGRALVLISRTNSLTQTHALFLEWHCLQAVRQAARFVPHNGNNASRPHPPALLEADCLEIFDTGRTLLATLGYSLFDPVARAVTKADEPNELFFCTAVGVKGRGQFTEEGFVVLNGSVGRRKSVPSISGTADERFRLKLIDAQVMKVSEETLVFQKDYLFNSPSMAAVALLGRTANGWREWKTADGRTLDEVKRQGRAV
jgi:hypothetical protein